MNTKSINNLFVYESGSPEAPAILFLHGSPLSGRMWQPQLESLSEFHCLAPDLPEHGKSTAIAPFDMQDTVRRMAELIKTSTPTGKAHVVGLSFGGAVVQAMLAHTPEVVETAMISGTSMRADKTLRVILKLYLDLNKPFLALLPPGWISGLVTWQFGIPKQYGPAMAEDMGVIKGDALARLVYESYTNIETPERPAAPVLVAVGSKETFAAKYMARRLHQKMAGSQGVIAPGASHVWNMQQRELFNATLRAWVCRQPLPKELVAL